MFSPNMREKIAHFIRFLLHSNAGRSSFVVWGVMIFMYFFLDIIMHSFGLHDLWFLLGFTVAFYYIFVYRVVYRRCIVEAAKAAIHGSQVTTEWGEFDMKAYRETIKANKEAFDRLMATLDKLEM
jgi:hypothetical protein